MPLPLEPATAPIVDTPSGERYDLGLLGAVVVVYREAKRPWRVWGSGELAMVRAPHQVFVDAVKPITAIAEEVVAIDVDYGLWQTVWAAPGVARSFATPTRRERPTT